MGTSKKSGMIKHSGRQGANKTANTAVGSMKTSLKPGNKEALVSSGGERGGKVKLNHIQPKAVKVHDHKKEINMADQAKSVYHMEDGEGKKDKDEY